jgi:hypothetical protein
MTFSFEIVGFSDAMKVSDGNVRSKVALSIILIARPCIGTMPVLMVNLDPDDGKRRRDGGCSNVGVVSVAVCLRGTNGVFRELGRRLRMYWSLRCNTKAAYSKRITAEESSTIDHNAFSRWRSHDPYVFACFYLAVAVR